MQLSAIRHYSAICAAFLLLAFPLFYFVYKFGDPEPLAHDFFQYYYLYKDFDIGHVIAPHNMRLLSSYLVHLLYSLNFYYDTATVFDKYSGWGFLESVYFNAVFFNYLCVSGTCVVIFSMVEKHFKNILLSFIAGLLYLLGFGTLFYEMMPLTDAFSVFLFSIGLYFYLEEKKYLLPLLALFVLQREYILIVFITLAASDAIYFKKRFYLLTLCYASVFFTVYLILRKTVFYTPHLDYQASAGYFSASLLHVKFPLVSYLRQTAMTLNLFYLYLCLLIYKKWKGRPLDAYSFFKLMVLFVQINIICHLAGHGTNCGRYFYMTAPFIIFLIIKEVVPLLKKDPECELSGVGQ